MDICMTQEVLDWVASKPARVRKALLKELGRREWENCADDVKYWMDATKHAVPYVYTKDPHPMYQCLRCPEGSDPHTNDKLQLHLQLGHGMEVDNYKAVRAHYRELPTSRPFPMHEYFEPLIDVWLSEQLVLVEKSRDMMMSWLTIALYTWDTIYHSGRENFFQSETASKTIDLVRRGFHIYKHQPSFLKDQHKFKFAVGQNNAGYMYGESLDSQIIGVPQGDDQVRQYHPTGMFTDETAFHKDAGETFAAIKPAIQNGGRYTGVSSAYPGWFMLACKDQLDMEIPTL